MTAQWGTSVIATHLSIRVSFVGSIELLLLEVGPSP